MPLKISDVVKDTPTLVKWANEIETQVNQLQNIAVPKVQQQAAATASAVQSAQTGGQTTSGAPTGNIIAQDVTGVSVTQAMKILNGTTYTQLTVTYTAPLVGSLVQDVSKFPTFYVTVDVFGGIFLGIKGYQGSTQIVKIAEDNYNGGPGGTQTFTVNLFPTGETVDLFFIAKNLNGVTVDNWSNEPSLAIVLNGAASANGIVTESAANGVPNSAFSASLVTPLPGWVTETGVTVTLDTSSASFFFAGGTPLGSPKLVATNAHTGLVASLNYRAVPGDTFKSSCVAQVLAGSTAELSLAYFDVNNNLLSTDTATTTSTSWVTVQLTSLAPASSVYVKLCLRVANAGGTAWFQIPGIQPLNDGWQVTPTNSSGTFTGGNPLSAASTGVVTISASTIQFANGQVSYNSGSISGLTVGLTYYIYADDPAFKGGAVTYVATTSSYLIYGANGRIYFGKVTIPAGGSSPGTGGGGGGGRGIL